VKNPPALPPKKSNGSSTAGGRELTLKTRPPARFISQAHIKKRTETKDKETKTTAPFGNTPFGTTNHLSG